MENLIEVRGLCKQYPDFMLDHVDLTVPAGCIVGLIGENGAGKTTTIKAILNVIRPGAGTIKLMGQDPKNMASREQVAVVFEDSYFYGGLTTRQISRSMQGICKGWDAPLFKNYCERFGLGDKKPVKDFSRGMRMKLSLATAFARHPKLLILDEATSGLDPVVRGEMLELFLEFIQDETCSILFSSHITTDLERVADQIVYLRKGKLLFQRDKNELLAGMAVLRCSSADIDKLPPDVVLARQNGAFGQTALVSNPALVRTLLPNAVVDSIRIDEMMQLYSGEGTK